MIVDRLDNWRFYTDEKSLLGAGFLFLEKALKTPPLDGRKEVDGERVYAIEQSYETRPAAEKKWEAHRRYADIQLVVSGRETMFWTPVPLLRPVGSYDPKRDVLFFDEAVGSPVAVESGCFAVFFPEDAHKPGCLLEKALAVRKVVVKVLCAG